MFSTGLHAISYLQVISRLCSSERNSEQKAGGHTQEREIIPLRNAFFNISETLEKAPTYSQRSIIPFSSWKLSFCNKNNMMRSVFVFVNGREEKKINSAFLQPLRINAELSILPRYFSLSQSLMQTSSGIMNI
jgi:hypothetical protein